MWFRDVEVPDAVLEAHRRGQLVLFVGAGASVDGPSSLPLFKGLAQLIAEEAALDPTPAELAQPDVLLGRINDQHNVDVHLRVATHIASPKSRPNRLHKALAVLASANSVPPRIVTTNYDTHLSRALKRSAPMEYVAPALPIGDDFHGIVYLHGNVSQEPRHLVVTDEDFGRAYLRDAWAARFLERMFARYTVVFVGYSHTDVVMRYLARALSGDAHRYIFTDLPDATDWRQLRITPIGYTVRQGSHIALFRAVDAWGRWARMGLLDHRERIRQLTHVPPPNVPDDASYLEQVIREDSTAAIFVEFARGDRWLSWMSTQAPFRALLTSTATETPTDRMLALWFAEHYVMDESHSTAAMNVVAAGGGRIGSALWHAIGLELHRRGSPRPRWLAKWIVLLIENAPAWERLDWLDYALVASQWWPDDRDIALLLFDFLTEPRPGFQRMFGLGDASFEITIRGDAHDLDEAWANVFKPNLTVVVGDILAIADRHLRRAHRLLHASDDPGSPSWDVVSRGRATIETHSQMGMRRPLDVLIDAARDSIEVLFDTGGAGAARQVDAWADSDIPVLRRLAVHAWIYRTDIDATAKITWLRARGWLFDRLLHHEVYRLIQESLANADPNVANALVDDMTAGPPGASADERTAYTKFEGLAWMVEAAPELASAVDRLAEIKTAHPDFALGPHPDLLTWHESGGVGAQPPFPSSELHERIAIDPAAAIASLREFKSNSFRVNGPDWHDALALVSTAVTEHPIDGIELVRASQGDADLTGAVINGWSRAAPHDEVTSRVLDELNQLNVKAVVRPLASMLSGGGQSDETPIPWHNFERARALARRCWSDLEPQPIDHDGDGWLSRAINHPAGDLAEFWLHAIAADWREAGDAWDGLQDEVRTVLETMIAGDDDRSAMAQTVIASQLRFFAGADLSWCVDHVLPLFDWTTPDRARRAWDGFLVWGQPHDKLLESGLLDHYLATVKHRDQLREETRRQLAQHLAAIALYSALEPLPWLGRFTAAATVPDRVAWIDQVEWMLRELPPDAVSDRWRRWMRTYWRRRLESVHAQLSIAEASALATWAVHLQDLDDIEEAVDLATSHDAGLGSHADLLHHLKADQVARAPSAYAQLIAHLLSGTQKPFWGSRYLQKFVQHLRAADGSLDLSAIREEALRLQLGDPISW